MTNEEKIKSMSRDMLAEFLYEVVTRGRNYGGFPPICSDMMSGLKCPSQTCYNCIHEWLSEEAKE